VGARLFGSLVLSCAIACSSPPPPDPPPFPELPARHRDGPSILVVGIDGADWNVIHELWDQGRLPHLRRLAQDGAQAELGTDYGASPVIWSTIATGRPPEVHGITDFVAATDRGSVPVSSSLRRVPALWNIASRARLRTAVLGWWASWPAEEVAGVVVSDRAHLALDRIVYPENYLESFLLEREKARSGNPGFGGALSEPDVWMEDGAERDRIVAHEARRLVGLGFDLFLVYFRAVDIASHRYWKYLEPRHYPSVTEVEARESAHVIPTVYDATDQAIGEILAASPQANVFVISDHGFISGPEQAFVNLSAERLLERLGFLVRNGDAVDFSRSVAYPFESPDHARKKKFRISKEGREPSGMVRAKDVPDALAELTRALAEITYDNGTPVFQIRGRDLDAKADLVAEVNITDPTLEIVADGRKYEDVVLYVNRISGTHGRKTHGIFIAAGPDVLPGARLDGITIFDVAPTILYALGLPTADDFSGKPRVELFQKEFRNRHPVRTLPSWGTMSSWGVESSPVDSKILEELRALGYLEP
jgi:predicted AlkP superfamily phosphohydrolase/phosphomutase